ncbi:MAG TPA: M14 family metallopeptidase [Actinomycetota bacterium]|nr:M14 family metallopeptidase [Actinomycetota bacterium]
MSFKRITVAALMACLVMSLAPAARTANPTLMVVRVHVDSPREAAELIARFDDTHNHGHDEVELLLWPGDEAELRAMGIDYTVVTRDLVARDAELAAQTTGEVVEIPGPDRDDYRHLADYNTELAAIADEYPSMARLIELPEVSLEGRTAYGIEIAKDVKANDGRPTFYIDGVHHAREWPAGELPLLFAYHLLESYGKDKAVTALLGKLRVIVVPIVNVDGFDYSRESVLSLVEPLRPQLEPTGLVNGFEGYWRKNRRSLTGVTIPAAQKNPDAYGVDNNRNYSYLWGDQNGGSANEQYDATYRGDAPFSEPENRNIRDLVLTNEVTGMITNHTYQGSVLRPGGPGGPDYPLIFKISNEIAARMGNQYDARDSVGYPTTGTTDDWVYAVTGAIGFTIEHGRVGFHPAYTVGVGDPAGGVMAGFQYMAEVAANPKYHSVLTGKVAGGAAKLTLTRKWKTPLSEGNPIGEEFVTESLKYTLNTNPDGSFEWHVPPSISPQADGNTAYTLTITRSGSKKVLSVKVNRGQRLNLGSIAL